MKIAVKPNVLKTLRTSLNIPADVAATKADVTEAAYLAWEASESNLSMGVLKDLAKLYGRHWTVFLLDVPPKLPKPPKDFRTLPDAESSYSRSTIEAFLLATRILRLSDEVEGRDFDAKLFRSFSADISNHADDLASLFTDLLGPSDEDQKKIKSAYNLFRFWSNRLEEHGVNVAEISMEVSEVRAFSMQEGKKAVIVINRSDTINGRVFSLMHETCHLLLGTTGICDWSHTVSTNYLSGRVEVFCNQFAGASLVPSSKLVSELNNLEATDSSSLVEDDVLDILARKFKVSSQVILRRLYSLGQITKPDYDAKYALLSARYKSEGRVKKDFIPPANFHTVGLIKQNSRAFTTDVINAYKSNAISYRDAGIYLDIPTKHLSKIETELGYK